MTISKGLKLQWFPPNCAAMLLNLAHDQMGHNGSARTYMLLKRLYYWKGMKTDINIYVRQCKLCQRQNIVPVKYSQGHFLSPHDSHGIYFYGFNR